MDSLLSHIQSVEDLRKLSLKELPQLCDELRQYIIEQTAFEASVSRTAHSRVVILDRNAGAGERRIVRRKASAISVPG